MFTTFQTCKFCKGHGVIKVKNTTDIYETCSNCMGDNTVEVKEDKKN